MSSHGMSLLRSSRCRCCYSDHGRVAAGTFMSMLEPLCLTYSLLLPRPLCILQTVWWHTLLTSSWAFPSHIRL